MTTKKYELTIIAHPEASEKDIKKLKELIERHAEITKEEVEGVKRLAYSMFGQDEGRYLYYEVDVKEGEAEKLSDTLNVIDTVLRYLLVRSN